MKSLLLALALFVPAASMASLVALPQQQGAAQTPNAAHPAERLQAQTNHPLIDVKINVIILPARGAAKQPTLDFGNGKAAISSERLSLRSGVYLDRPNESHNVIVCYDRACDEHGSIR